MRKMKLVHLVAVTVAVFSMGLLLTVAPASAVAGIACDGAVTEERGLWYTVYDEEIQINGILYGLFSIGVSNYEDIHGPVYEVRVAVRDVRQDGLPPYIYLDAMSGADPLFTTAWYHSYQSASGGWECHSFFGLGHIKELKIRVFGSVDNAPSVPEIGLLTLGVVAY